MFLIFLFFETIQSTPKEKIKHAMNITIGLCVIYPDSTSFNIESNNFLENLMSMIKGRFSFSSYRYSQYSLSDKSTFNKNTINIVLTRDDKFLERYIGNTSAESIAEEINDAFYSYVEVLNESTLNEFKEDMTSLFLLTGSSITKEFEDAAFFYRHSKARFGFLYQNTENDSLNSVLFIKNKNNVSRAYDSSVPLIQFIRSCKVEKQRDNFQRVHTASKYPKHSAQFVAITDNFSDEVRAAFDYINNSNYGNAIDFEVVSWENATELKKMCQIKKTESNLTYVFYSKKGRKYTECNVFQDMDFYSKELLSFFVSKSFKGWLSQSSTFKSGSSNIFNFFANKFNHMGSSPIELNQASLSSFIPGSSLSLVFIECPNSFSLFEANTIFNVLLHEFNEKKFSKDENGRYLKPVDFFKFEYYVDCFQLPSADAFPTFVMFRPNNKQANVFNEILTIENLRNWILKFVNEEEEENEEENYETEKQSNSNFDFTTFIHDLSLRNNEKYIYINEIPKNSDKQEQISPSPTPTPISQVIDSSHKTAQKDIKKEDTDSSESPLKNFLNNLGLNFDLDDIHEIKIVGDLDYLNLDDNSILDENKDTNNNNNNNNNNMNTEEIERLVNKIAEKKVKNLFNQEKAKMKNEIINEVLDILNIHDKSNLTGRTKIIKIDKQMSENNDIKSETVNPTKKVAKEEAKKSEVENKIANDSDKNENKKEVVDKNMETENQETKNDSKEEDTKSEVENKVTSDSIKNVQDKNENKKEVVDHNYDQEKESAKRKKINSENQVFDLEEDSEDL